MVQADLALEPGEAELGNALFCADEDGPRGDSKLGNWLS